MAAACSSSSSAQASAMTLPNVPLASLDAGVFRNVLSFLEPDDVSDLASASRDLRKKTITQSGSLLIGQTRTFIQGICAELGDDEKYAVQREALQRVLGSFTPSASSSSSSSSSSSTQITFHKLRDVKKHAVLFKEAIIDALRGIDIPMIESCEKKASLPRGMCANIWSVLKVYAGLRSIDELSIEDFDKAAASLLDLGERERALTLARSAPASLLPDSTLDEIALDFLSVGKKGKALEAASEASPRMKVHILYQFLRLGESQLALQLARSIPEVELKDEALQVIAFDYIQSDNFEKATCIAHEISNLDVRMILLDEIASEAPAEEMKSMKPSQDNVRDSW